MAGQQQQQHPVTLPTSAMAGSHHFSDVHSLETGLQSNRPTPAPSALMPSHYGDSMAYQVIKWRPFLRDTWHPVYDRSKKEL